MATKERWILSFVTGAGNLDREVLNTDSERITAFYYENGYIDVRVDEPKIERDEDGLKVTFKIDEGEQYHFGEVNVVGETLPDMTGRRPSCSRSRARPSSPASCARTSTPSPTAYGDLGYAFVNVTPETDIDPAEQDGRRQLPGHARPGGLHRPHRDQRQHQDARQGDPPRARAAGAAALLRHASCAAARSACAASASSRTSTSPRARPRARTASTCIVDVREGSTGAFSAGAGISSGESFLFNVRLSEINLFGRGQAVVLNADFGSHPPQHQPELHRAVLPRHAAHRSASTPSTGSSSSTSSRAAAPAAASALLYPFPALGLDVIRLGPLGQVSLLDTRIGLEYRIEDADISNVSRGAADRSSAPRPGSSLTSSIMPRIFRDTRNNLLDPTDGSFQDFSVEIAGLGGDSQFINAQSRARWYIPFWNIPALGAPIVFATGWNFGYGFGYGEQTELPLFERYFPGGINSVRGFQVRSLGPQQRRLRNSRSGNCRSNAR